MYPNIYFAFAFVMGLTMSVYLPMNSSVSKHIGSPMIANVTFFAVGLATSILIFFFFGQFKAVHQIKNVPTYLYSTGFFSALIVLGTTVLIPHIGARKFFILLIAGQVTMAMIVSHFGILNSPEDPINLKKIIGAVLVLTGVFLSSH